MGNPRTFIEERAGLFFLFIGPLIVVYHAIIEDEVMGEAYALEDALPLIVMFAQISFLCYGYFRYKNSQSESMKRSMRLTALSLAVTAFFSFVTLYFFHS
jgi:hypothetical protein